MNTWATKDSPRYRKSWDTKECVIEFMEYGWLCKTHQQSHNPSGSPECKDYRISTKPLLQGNQK